MKSERVVGRDVLRPEDMRTIRTTSPMDLGINHKITRAHVNASRNSVTTHAERAAAAVKRFSR